jgi:hypothetical protein
MANTKNKLAKPCIALFLALLLCCSASMQTVLASESTLPEELPEGVEVTRISDDKYARAANETGVLYTLYTSSFPGGAPGKTDSFGNLTVTVSHMMLTGGVYKAAYCLDHELGYVSGGNHTTNGTTMDDINGLKRETIGFILSQGFQWSGSGYGNWWSPADNDKWLVTQLLIWAVMNGKITIDRTTHLITIPDSVRSDIVKISPRVNSPSSFVAYYDSLAKKLRDVRKIPSFCTYPEETIGGKDKLPAQALNEIVLKNNGSSFQATATDTNKVLGNYAKELTKPGLIPDVTLKVNANALTLSCSSDKTGQATVQYTPQGGSNAVIAWKYAPDPDSYQRFASVGSAVGSVKALISVQTDRTSPPPGLSILKIAEDGKLEGHQFGITGSDGSYYTFTTDKNGMIDLSSLPAYEQIPVLGEDGKPMVDGEGNPIMQQGPVIVYTAQEINVPDRYIVPPPQSFTMVNGVVTAENVALITAAAVTKTAVGHTADPEKLFNENLEHIAVIPLKDGRVIIKVQDENGEKLNVPYALEIVNGNQVYHAYTDGLNGAAMLTDFDISQAKKTAPSINLVGFFQDGAFVSVADREESEGQNDFDYTFDGTYFYPLKD